jgi:biopolymer transport protein ExbD/biopolymer transport protein TolR
MAYKPKAGATMSTPNVVPMTDVMLVLLIIMMVITPMLQKGVTVDMARVSNPRKMPSANKTNAILISITRDGGIYFRTTKIPENEVTSRVRDAIKDRLNKEVFIKSDARAKYGSVVTVVDDVRAAGVEKLGLLTEKLTKPQPGPPTLGGG